MKNKIIVSILAGSMLMTGAGCKKFLDVNQDPSAAPKVQESLLLSGIEVNTAFTIAGGYPARTAAFWTQQMSYNVDGPDWDAYKSTPTDVNNTWAFDLYPASLNNLKIMEKQADLSGHTHYAAIAKILLAYNLSVATDFWNAVPCSDGFKGPDNFRPKYDTQEQVYQTIFTLLNDGVNLANGPDTSIVKPDTNDRIYHGNMAKWSMFGNLLKARYALRLCYAPGKVAVDQANIALAAIPNSFADASSNAAFPFVVKEGGNAPWAQFNDKWGSVAMSSTFVDLLKAKNDPRLPVVANPIGDGTYVGKANGTAVVPAATLSALGDFFAAPDQSVNLGTYDELLFIKAEATYLTSGYAAAQPILWEAVRATMSRFGLDKNGNNVNAYLTANCTLTAATAYETIMTEKYVANFLSMESFHDWRRTGFPKLKIVNGPYLNITSIARRFLYPDSELQTNARPEQSAKLTDRVWWDTK
ncbi:SusD-like starch-binding protein associating with outer membrane [Chitinophaga niastensis]|uniref:SusD-like starch-binding protein associating with outer membrane n=1 Tax=Chitinophaga niastensis TaxID=536980 RepID=A0A2P8HTY5_CHINA|nr:SusD/RagB family nutrient-binding outer membrane lipoprotein [Chitinophaga niastensis]PSL49624.1 SusD-like starch-binding protein associating with outer membrane [Chitinophaga niastensis]